MNHLAQNPHPKHLLHHLALKQDENDEAETFRPIDLHCLHPELTAPCDLYLKIRLKSRFTLFARKGLAFSPRDRQNMLDSGVEELYIREEDSEIFYHYLKDALTLVVRDPNCPSETKAHFVHAACRDIMSKVYTDPRASFITQAHEMLAPTVDLVVNDDRATRCLVQLTAHDVSTYTHCTNVGIFSIALTKILYGDSADHDLHKLSAGFFLHDLGKCKVPLEILNKPGKLDQQEWEVMQTHPQLGYELLEQTGHMTDEARIIILEHHEKDDGTGYPNGLEARDIHPYARICRLADVYEALTSDRPYHTRQSTFDALKLMKNHVLADIDQQLFAHFVKLFRL